MRTALLVISFCLTTAMTASAQDAATSAGSNALRQPASPQMAVVVESTKSPALGRRVRILLGRQSSLRIRSLKSFADQGSEPDLVVTVEVANGNDINVLYWDRTGVADVLTAPVPEARATTPVVAASLAFALVRRNLAALEQAIRSGPGHRDYRHVARGRALASLSPDQLRGLLASIGAVAHRTEGLTEADF